MELPDMSGLELEEIILIDPTRTMTKEAILSLYNISPIEPKELN